MGGPTQIRGPEAVHTKSGVGRGFSVYCSCLRWKRRLKQHPLYSVICLAVPSGYIQRAKINNKEVCNTYGARNSKVV